MKELWRKQHRQEVILRVMAVSEAERVRGVTICPGNPIRSAHVQINLRLYLNDRSIQKQDGDVTGRERRQPVEKSGY